MFMKETRSKRRDLMADYKLATNGKSHRSASPDMLDSESDIRQDVAAIKEDVVRLAQHLQSGNVHLLNDVKKSLDIQLKKASQFSRDSVKQMETRVREKPTQSVLVAFGAGLLASAFLARK
jgi:ElaB/YqjD/DUF883 family membrane-anchored ribosome-binding protein